MEYGNSASEAGPSAAWTCLVCGDDFDGTSSVTLPEPCGHSYCGDCLRQYIEVCCQDMEVFPPSCCRVRIPPSETLNTLIGKDLADKLELMIAEYDDVDKLYCSSPSCSRYLRQPNDGKSTSSTRNRYVRCVVCKTSTCRFCKYPWHPGKACGKSLAEDQVRALGAIHNWRACKRCGTMVEKIDGCDHMTCRCGAQFCYLCGETYPRCGLNCQQRQQPPNPEEIAAMERAIQTQAPPHRLLHVGADRVPAVPRPEPRNPPWRVSYSAPSDRTWWESMTRTRPVIDADGQPMIRREVNPARRATAQVAPVPRPTPRAQGGEAPDRPAAQTPTTPLRRRPATPASRTPPKRFNSSRPSAITPNSSPLRPWVATLVPSQALQARNLLPSH